MRLPENPRWKSPPVLPPPTHPPPASLWSLIRMQKASPAGFLSPPGSSPAFLTPPHTHSCNTSVAQTKRHKCKQEINSIVFYFSINLSSWQVQQKIIKLSGGKTMCHSRVTFKRGGGKKKASSSDVGASFPH